MPAKLSTKATDLSESEVRKIAVEASADPRTVRRVLNGQATKGMASQRIAAVLRRMALLAETPKGGR
jgi:hypothetical protein